MELYTLQEVRDILKREFKGKSERGDQCFYRDGTGKKCAIGCFIPDENYTYDLEDWSLSDIVNELPYVGRLGSSELIGDFRDFHDSELSEDTSVQVQRDALFNEYVKLRKEYQESID